MKSSFPWAYRLFAVLLVFLLCGAPELMAQAAQQPQTPTQEQQQPSQQLPQSADPAANQQAPAQQSQSSDASQPAQSNTQDQLPNAPSSLQPLPPSPRPSQPAQPEEAQNGQTAQQSKRAPHEPEGVAVAGEAKTAGGPASKPAGTAIAPAKQRQVRSLLIKIGAIAAGGAAFGIIYGLSRGTPSIPPNTNTAGATQAH
jgi:hypothetical protein